MAQLTHFLVEIGLNNILFTVTLTYYDIYIHTLFLGFDAASLSLYDVISV